MIYIERFFSDSSCNLICESIKLAIAEYQSYGKEKQTLSVFNNHEVPALRSTFDSLPEFPKIGEIIDLASIFTGEQIDYSTTRYTTFGWYGEGCGLGAHRDVSSAEELELVCTAIMYFNDDYRGGELAIYDLIESPEHYRLRNEKDAHEIPGRREVAIIKPPTGSVILINSNVFHEVKPIISGEKYIATMLIHRKKAIDGK